MSEKTVIHGPGFLTLLAVLFIALKLTGFIAWSWIWVLAPVWIPLAIVLGVLLAAGSMVVIGSIFGAASR